MKILPTFALALCLTIGASAQCSDITVGGTLVSGGDVSFSVTGAPAESMTLVFVATDTGSFGVGGFFTLGLAMPAIPIGQGMTDANGDFSTTINIPNIPAGVLPMSSLDLYAQSLTISYTIPTFPTLPGTGGGFLPFSFCDSDVEAFTITF